MVVCTVAAGPAPAATTAVVLSPGQVAEAASQGTAPSDGRLRGQDFTAVVSKVAWPQSVQSTPASTTSPGMASSGDLHGGGHTADRRLGIAERTDGGLGGAQGRECIAPRVDDPHQPGDRRRHQWIRRDDRHRQLRGLRTCGYAQCGSRPYRGRVQPVVRSLDAQAPATESGRPLSGPTSSSVTGTPSTPFHLSFTNPADGFTSTDNAQVSSATLTYFAPGQSLQTPKSPDEAYLILGLQSSYPESPTANRTRATSSRASTRWPAPS